MRKLNLLNYFIIVLIVLSIIGMLGNFVQFYKLNFSSRDFYKMDSNLGNLKYWFFFGTHINFYAGLFFLQQAIYSIYKNKKFTIKTKIYFNYSALILFGVAVLKVILYLIDKEFYDKSFLIQSVSFSFLEIILAMVLFAVSDMVTIGKLAQEENELTI